MHERKLVSIIVPVYNVEQYLEACLKGLICQTYKEIEIILVDDGSTDKSGKICDTYAEKDKRIRVIHKKNGGLSDARNAGIDVSNGEILAFVDSDDVVSEFFVSIMIKELVKNNLEIVSLDHGVNFYDSTEKNIVFAKDENDYTSKIISSRDAIQMMLYQRIMTGTPWRVYKKEIFNNLRFPYGIYYEDSATTHKTFMKTDSIGIIHSNLYAYRIRKSSIMHQVFSERKLICMRISDQIVNDIQGYDISLLPAAYNRAFSINYQVFIQIPFRDRTNIKAVFQYLKKYRAKVLKDTNKLARIKNKIGALCTYAGTDVAWAIGRIAKKIGG